ncbi:MAG: MarR family transcriptional regulator [Oscillospiraceae bacterium]|nr:MarR family transcriptional regulator [Oscillospiraceae bacterium]
MERDGIIIGGFVHLSTALTILQKNLERVKYDRVHHLNLKNSEVLVMYLFYDNPEGLSAEQLSRECQLDRSLISRSLRSLSSKKLITCPRPSESKRRYGSKLVLTEEGKRLGALLKQYAKEVEAFLNVGIPREELLIMYKTLDTLCERFELLNRESRALKTAKKEEE